MVIDNEIKEDKESQSKLFTDTEEQALNENINEIYEKCLKKTVLNLKLDENLISKAVKCLKKIILAKYKDSSNILSNERDEFLYVNMVFSKFPFKVSIRPVTITLPTGIYGNKYNTSVCIFVKDPKTAFKDLGLTFPFNVKVIDVSKLKIKYSRFQERRNLIKQYELFFCDSKIYFLLKKLLGKPFYTHRKYPLPLTLDYSNPEKIKSDVINHVENTTVFNITHGPNYTIKCARLVESDENIVKNVVSSATLTIPHILKWGLDFKDLKSISLRGLNTIELPFYNYLTEEEINAFLEK